MSDDLKTLVAQEVAKQLAAIAADQTTKKVLEFLKNRNSADAYVVETGGTSSNWFRAWSDGFLEQGGVVTLDSAPYTRRATVSFLRSFSNTDYSIQVTSMVSTDRGFSEDKTTSSCIVGTNAKAVENAENKSTHANWYACGF